MVNCIKYTLLQSQSVVLVSAYVQTYYIYTLLQSQSVVLVSAYVQTWTGLIYQ